MKTTSFSTTFIPVRLLPQLRLLSASRSATHFPPMTFAPTLSSSRAVPILSRVFPLRLRYMGLGFRRSLQTERAFSTRPFRGPRTGSGSELPRGYERRAGGGGASKSLIEDEAELSDWVSELRSDSPGGRDDELKGRRGRVRESCSDRESYPMKKRRSESDSGDFGDSRRREFRSPNHSFPRNGGRSKRLDDKFEGDKKDRPFPPRNNLGNSHSSREFGGSSRQRFPNPNESFSGNSGIRKRLDNKFQGDDDKEDGLFRPRNNRGNSNSFWKGNSSSNLKADSFTRNRGGEGLRRGARDSGKTLRVMDDTEEEEDRPTSVRIEDLLSEEESDTAISDDDDDDDGYGVLREKSATSLFGSDNEVSKKVFLKSSTGSSDSYLSESRFDQCSVSPLSLKGIKDAGYEKMTVVQEATLPVILKGKDVLAKAKTGTGKTVAFLV